MVKRKKCIGDSALPSRLTDREWQALSITVGRILLVKHVVQCGDLAVCIGDLSSTKLNTQSQSDAGTSTYDRETNVRWLEL